MTFTVTFIIVDENYKSTVIISEPDNYYNLNV